VENKNGEYSGQWAPNTELRQHKQTTAIQKTKTMSNTDLTKY
jgi:hypothetical protein